MKEKKLMFLTPSIKGGGAEKILLFVAKTMKDKGYNVELITLSNYHDKEIYNMKVHYIESKFQGKISSKVDYIIKIRKKLIKSNVDCVISFGVAYTLISKLAIIGLPIKIISSERRSPMNLSFFWKTVSKLLYKKCDGIVFQLKEVEEIYNIENNKSVVIPNPCIVKNSNLFEEKRKVIISAAARLDEYEKGMDVLINAFNRISSTIPEYELHLYGDILNDNNILNLSKKNEKIKIFPKTNNIIDKINEAFIFVLPSRVEGIPNILLESLASGNVTISSDCPPGGPRLLTKNGIRGELFNNNDYKELADKILLLINDTGRYKDLQNLSKEVINEFDQTKIEAMWFQFIDKIISGDDNH